MRIAFATYPWAFALPGGGERQMQFYLQALRRGQEGWPDLDARLFDQWKPNFDGTALLHYFSCMPSSRDFVDYVKVRSGVPVVISPNFWPDPEGWAASGVLDNISAMLWLADKVIVNSNIEKEVLVRSCPYVDPARVAVVYNAVEDCFFEPVSPDIFRERYNVRGRFVLNVGNVEQRKNQFAFLKALKAFPEMQLITVGSSRDVTYLQACREEGGGQFLLLDPLEPGSELLRSALAGCEFFAMPSLCETPSIASLEAGAAGAKVLTTDQGSPREYFGEHVAYVNPYDINGMQEAIGATLARPADRLLIRHVRDNYRWDLVVKSLVKIYSDVARQMS